MRITQPPTVIFIASESRSGSTLLDFLIGSHSDVVSGGELIDLQSTGSSRKEGGEQCTCGTSIRVCEHWRAVNAELHASAGQSIDSLALHSPDNEVFRRDNLALFSRLALSASVLSSSTRRRSTFGSNVCWQSQNLMFESFTLFATRAESRTRTFGRGAGCHSRHMVWGSPIYAVSYVFFACSQAKSTLSCGTRIWLMIPEQFSQR